MNAPKWIPQTDRCPYCREEMKLWEIAPRDDESALEAGYYCPNPKCDHYLRRKETYQFTFIFTGKGYVTRYLEYITTPNTIVPNTIVKPEEVKV